MHSEIVFRFRGEIEEMEEEKNILEKEIEKNKKILDSLPKKYERVIFLFNSSRRLIELSEPEEILDTLVEISAEIFPQGDNILLFLLAKHNLNLVRSLKRKDSVIKEKKGDIIDKWVVKNNQCLLVEDLTKDFRFDYNKMICFKERNIFSLIVMPLSVGDRIIGTMRIESKNPSQFSLDDSRILRSICDLGTVVLERAQLFKNIEELAVRDSLTSLFLRDYFFGRLKEEIRRSVLTRKGLGIIMLDIDDFKKINDTYGHVVGDLVLKKLSKILINVIGDTGNVICRFGGEEFILFVVSCDKKQLISLGEEIRKKVESAVVTFRRKNINFTVSLGAVSCPEDGTDLLDLIDKVDHLLYKAKKKGKNRLCFLRG
jgi:diguanylate cyclase (GGDEF)-like protein